VPLVASKMRISSSLGHARAARRLTEPVANAHQKRASRALLQMGGLLIFLAACSPQPVPEEAPSGPRVPLYRLSESLASGPLPASLASCRVGDEIRPALGCLPRIDVADLTQENEEQWKTELSMPVPKQLRGKPFILGATLQGKRFLDWREMSPRFIGPRATWIRTPMGEENIARGEVWARPLPANYLHYRTKALPIPARARLNVATGMSHAAAAVGASPANLRLEVEAGNERKVALATWVSGDGDRWQEHSIDLSAYAGQEVVFHFISTVAEKGGETTFTAPLWGSPIVSAPTVAPEKPNVLLLSLDTLRADYVGVERGGRSLTPRLDQFRARSTVFQNAMTTYPSTTASHMSLFTGLYPATHDTNHARKRLPDRIPTMAEAFATGGYLTAAVTENAMLSAESGFKRGFDFYREQKSAEVWSSAGAIQKTFEDGLAWLRQHPDERFFLFLHTYQVHYPYTPPAEYDLFRTPLDEASPEDGNLRQILQSEQAYAAEVHYTDAEVGRLLETLESEGFLDNTIVLITSDHGEEFGEHGSIGHSHALHAEVLNIPLSIFFPSGAPTGKAIDIPVSLVDILPTLLDILDLPARKSDGRSLVPLLEGRDFGDPRAIFAQNFGKNGAQFAARTSSHKFNFEGEDSTPGSIYDIRSDPKEQQPLTDEELANEGRRWIESYKDLIIRGMTEHMRGDREADSGQTSQSAPVDADLANKLRALGYAD
jgi:arylsulfatase A-like enzyme